VRLGTVQIGVLWWETVLCIHLDYGRLIGLSKGLKETKVETETKEF
jgi:hypothetical protein